MNVMSTPQDILSLPESQKESNHPSCDRIGYHVYLSYYFKLFNGLEQESKKAIMVRYEVWDDDDIDDDETRIDSTITPRYPVFYEISRAAARKWNQAELEWKNV